MMWLLSGLSSDQIKFRFATTTLLSSCLLADVEVIFNALPPHRGRLKAMLLDAASLWRHRLPSANARAADAWCTLFSFIM